MLGFLRDMKDPWKLLVTALVLANIFAAVAVVMMLNNRKTAEAARNEAQIMLQAPTAGDRKEEADIYRELHELAKIRALTRNSELEGTSESDVRRYIHKLANQANLPTARQIPYKTTTPRKGIREHTWTLIFTEKDPNISREQLAFFLFTITSFTPQLKIRSVSSGSSSTDPEKADRWKPQVVFVLTKEAT